MRSYLILIVSIVMGFNINAQGFKEAAYHKMIKTMLSHNVDEIYAKDLEYDSTVLYLDAREISEYEVSRIKNAKLVGYDNFKIETVKDLDKSQEIIVYCTAGYRSEKITEKLKANGFTNVTNMLGGLIEWANYSKPIVDSADSKTNKVHVFSRTWGIWLDEDISKKVY
jgi:rhodanese-related sulfurtransferase